MLVITTLVIPVGITRSERVKFNKNAFSVFAVLFVRFFMISALLAFYFIPVKINSQL